MKAKAAVFFFVFCSLLPAFSFAQCNDPFDPNCNNGTVDTPIDSWLLILLIAGAAYGVVKYRKQREFQ